ncbi:uncharacterized protein [Primulina huaijiensis]|uniref:uncharacterized protein n=1 Tax=Primulina huaijiensis TaxID=1492673 RepID=UPI003CC6EB3D
MASSSTQSAYRSMNEKCTALSNLKPETRNWFVRVLVVEKNPIRFSKWGRQQKIIFLDKENTSMQSIIYEQDVDQLNKLVELYKTYYVGNAKIKEISGNTPIMAASKHQMILSRSTYIKLADVKEQLPVDHAYELTSFGQFPQIADMHNKQIS